MAASASLRVHVSVRPLVEQFQPSPPALAIELNESAGNGSVTVTVEPSVGELPTLETASVNVVGSPSIRLPLWLLLIVSDGAETVLIDLRRGVGERRPEREAGEVAFAWLTICWPGAVVGVDRDVERHRVGLARRDAAAGRGIAARAKPEDHLPGARVELGRVVADRVGRTRRRLGAGGYPKAVRDVRRPRRDRVAHHEVGGRVRARVRIRHRVAQVSPRWSGPPGWVMFATDFELVMFGANRSVANVTTAGKYVSPLVVTTMLAEVALLGRMPFALTSIES